MYLTAALAHPILPVQYHAAYAKKVRSEVPPHAEEMVKSMAEAMPF